MKQAFSTHWISSSQKRKQHKYRANAPLHIRHKFLSANLSKDLRKKYGKRNLPLRTGDEVLVMRGSFSKKKAKVSSINLKYASVYLENIQRTKKDGTKINVKFHPSVLQIHTLSLDDKKRTDSIERKGSASTANVPKEKVAVKKTNEKSKPKENKNASN